MGILDDIDNMDEEQVNKLYKWAHQQEMEHYFYAMTMAIAGAHCMRMGQPNNTSEFLEECRKQSVLELDAIAKANPDSAFNFSMSALKRIGQIVTEAERDHHAQYN
jgi:hypothetical protein